MAEQMTLEDTIDMMLSNDWEDRFFAEYYQLKIRHQKLKEVLANSPKHIPPKALKLLALQETIMASYVAVLEDRAEMLGFDLKGKKAA